MASDTTIEYTVNCKTCGKPVRYSGMMYEKLKELGESRPEYCEEHKNQKNLEKSTMGSGYYDLKTIPGTDLSVVIPGELGKVSHPDRPHVPTEEPKKFDASKFGATPNKIVEVYEWLKDPKHQVVIIKGGTGSGKSTALPYWLNYPPEGVPSDFFTRDGQIFITQPRILATKGVSEYLGSLMGSSVGKGKDVGYKYSSDKNSDRYNSVVLATDGTLINMIKKGQLADLGVIMIDEAHERSLNIDICLYLLRDQLPLYPHLKLLIVSATINAESFLNYFGRETATLVEFEPKSKFIYIGHFADESEKIAYEEPNRLKKQLVPALVKKVVWLLKEQAEGRKGYGHILSFLQGVKPIEEAVTQIRAAVAADPKLKNMVEVLPLYSTLPEEESDKAIKITEPSKIRVIVATNVAEASITVEGVIYVIESGVENQAQWEIEDQKQNVDLQIISKANAKQRFGRSGRTRNGEVFCLYTEKQFDTMLDFPIPAIQRSSMEAIILRLKELGIDDYDQNWIDSPITKELNRSVSSLKDSGAIDANSMLTEYGALLSQFQYPASLADLVIMADRFGCAVEMATLLPIIKSGGSRDFLSHDTSWDEPTKQRVEEIQKTLWKDCQDDVEFIFRMYSFWHNPPSSLSEDEENGKKSLSERREEFAKTFYVNFAVFEDKIEPEREKLLSLLNGHKHDRNIRNLQFELIDRVRVILAFCVPFETVTAENYYYNSRLEIKDGATASCQLAISSERLEKVALLKSQKTSPFDLAVELIGWEENRESSEDIEKRLLATPILPVIDTKVFEDFASKRKIGETITVTVNGYTKHSTDFRESLAVVDAETGYQTWLTPADLNFTTSTAIIEQIPLGTKLKVVVKEIGMEKTFVRLSCLPLLEARLEATYASTRKIDGQIVTKAKVIGVRTDNKIIFAAELSKPEEGFILVVHATDKVLSKKVEEYHVGDTCLVSFKLDTGFEYHANLPSVSTALQEYLKSGGARLSWSDGRLGFRGKLKYSELKELAKIDDNKEFLSALDYLYLTSNMNWASKVNDASWAEKAKTTFSVGQTLEAKVIRVLSVGVLFQLNDDFTGFARTTKENEPVHENNSLKVKIIGVDEERQQISLSIVLPEVKPMEKFAAGTTLTGTVDNIAEYGAFVNLGRGFSGLIHISKLGRRVNKVSDMLKKGDKVTVEVLEVKNDQGRWKISLRLVSIVT